MWLMIEMEKIDYFRTLSIATKQELIYGMERFTYKKGEKLCKVGEIADKLFLIQQGIVEVAIEYDKRREGQNFVIERLGRGAIINHRSFFIKDDADTDFMCRTSVSCFVLHYDKMTEIKSKKIDLEQAKKVVKNELLEPHDPVALDYIFHNNNN